VLDVEGAVWVLSKDCRRHRTRQITERWAEVGPLRRGNLDRPDVGHQHPANLLAMGILAQAGNTANTKRADRTIPLRLIFISSSVIGIGEAGWVPRTWRCGWRLCH